MNKKKSKCSIVVLTYNEELNLEHLLRSLQEWAEAVFVVDSGSTDRTLEIAQRYGAQIYSHPWESHAAQFNWALDNLPITSKWVMRMDADEIVTPELAQELVQTLPTLPPSVTGLYVKRRVYFLGRWIRHGTYYPTWLLRVFRRGKARCEDLWMDEHIVLLEGAARKLCHDIIDYNRKGISLWTTKHEGYARREVIDLLSQIPDGQGNTLRDSLLGSQNQRRRWLKRHVYGRAPLFFRAFAYFLYRYFLGLGFLDGIEGLIFHFLQGCWYRFYVDARIYEIRQQRATTDQDCTKP